MLWYKAWLETRLRFLICVAGLTALCAYKVIRMDSGLTSPVSAAYYRSVLHTVATQLTLFSVLAINLTSMGGLLREKAVGAASFTLTLPFTRAWMAGVRMAVGLVETILLMAVPLVATFAIGAVFGGNYAARQLLVHLLYMASGGVVYYAIALFASCVVAGEYTAPIVSCGAAIAIDAFLQGPGVRSWDPVNFMMGGHGYNALAGLLTGPIPFGQIAVYGAIVIFLMLASVRALKVWEF